MPTLSLKVADGTVNKVSVCPFIGPVVATSFFSSCKHEERHVQAGVHVFLQLYNDGDSRNDQSAFRGYDRYHLEPYGPPYEVTIDRGKIRQHN